MEERVGEPREVVELLAVQRGGQQVQQGRDDHDDERPQGVGSLADGIDQHGQPGVTEPVAQSGAQGGN